MIKIVRDGDYLLVESHHLPRFLEQGWVVEKKPEIVEDTNIHGIPTELVELEKDGDIRLYEVNQVPAAKAAGWKEAGGQHGKHEHEGNDSRSGASEGHSGDPEGSGSDLGEPGAGSGSDQGSGSDDEPSEGREDLTTPAKRVVRGKTSK